MNVRMIVTDSVTVNAIGDIAITLYLLSYYQSGEQKFVMLTVISCTLHIEL